MGCLLLVRYTGRVTIVSSERKRAVRLLSKSVEMYKTGCGGTLVDVKIWLFFSAAFRDYMWRKYTVGDRSCYNRRTLLTEYKDK